MVRARQRLWRPEDLKALIDAAHQRGLMVFLDVVYNHFGPEGNYLGRYAPGFFTDAQTPWGSAIDYRVPQVRAFAIENALHWLRDYRFDGLRLDAVHAIVEPGEALDAASTEQGGRRARRRRPGGIFISCSRTTTTAPACSIRARTRRAANIARSGTTTITTPGTCC